MRLAICMCMPHLRVIRFRDRVLSLPEWENRNRIKYTVKQ